MRKTFIYIFVLAVIVFSAYSVYDLTLPLCRKPLKYDIGKFDQQFGITENEFKAQIAGAEAIWEGVLGRDVFVYEKDASFKINLIYDERQLATIQKQRAESGLTAIESTFRSLDSRFTQYKSEYERRSALYESALSSFNSRKAAYDKEVGFWNGKGGAPKEKFESLEAEREYLNSQLEKLNAEAAELNKMASELDALLKQRNAKASEYNRIAESYNDKYDSNMEFNQAEYSRREINVYQFGSKKDLTLALTHELGHALGMDHVDNPNSIMYYVTASDSNISLQPSPEDLAELGRVCK